MHLVATLRSDESHLQKQWLSAHVARVCLLLAQLLHAHLSHPMSLRTTSQMHDWCSTQQLRQVLSYPYPVAPTELLTTSDQLQSIFVKGHPAQLNALDRQSHLACVVVAVPQVELAREACQRQPQRKGRRPESIARAR